MNAQLPRIAPAIGSTSTGLSPYFKSGAGTRVMVGNEQRQILDAMYAMADKPSSQGYHALSMTKAVERLRAGGDLPSAQFQHHRPQRRCLVHSGFEIEYEVSPGLGGQRCIEIVDIRVTATQVKQNERSGLWEASFSTNSGWDAEKWLPDLNNVSPDSSIKVGINGYCKNAKHAAEIMPSHIARGKEDKLEQLKSTGYHLFYTPVKGGLKAGWESIMRTVTVHQSNNNVKDAQILAEYMLEAHKKSLKVEWVSHRGGSFVLTEAMKSLAQRNINLENRQTIFLSDATSSYAVADQYRRKLNMDVSDTKWIDGGYGIGHLAGGSNFGLAKVQTEWSVLKHDTAADLKYGKAAALVNNAYSSAKSNVVLAGAAVAGYQYVGLNGAFAAALYKLAPLLLQSIPSLTHEYQKNNTQALEAGINKSVKWLKGKVN